jgi:hypothetical protein
MRYVAHRNYHFKMIWLNWPIDDKVDGLRFVYLSMQARLYEMKYYFVPHANRR